MKAILLVGVVVLLLALVWAALHDILKGEPDLSLEYGTILFSLLIFGVIVFSWLTSKSKHRPSKLT